MPTREDLYELVWFKPMTKVAEEFGVSGSYLARVCSILQVPRPERGYWAKLAANKAPERPRLPAPRPGDPIVWSKDGDPLVMPVLKPTVPVKSRASRRRQPVTGVHNLIQGAKTHFETGRRVEEGQHLKPHKKLLVDITASQTALDKALSFANELFNALESAGHRVVIVPATEQLREITPDKHEQPKKKRQPHHYDYDRLWRPHRPTVVYVGTVAIGLAVIEISEEVLMRHVGGKYIREADYIPPKASRRHAEYSWTTTMDIPSGRLRLVAYSPYPRIDWSMTWQETGNTSLTRQISAIAKAIGDAAADLVEKIEEAERKAEIKRLEWLAEQEREKQEEDQRRAQQSIKDSRAQLGQIIQAWSDAMHIEQFLQDIEDQASRLPIDKRDAILDRLKLAREFIGTRNPLDFFLLWKTPLERYQPLSTRPKHLP